MQPYFVDRLRYKKVQMFGVDIRFKKQSIRSFWSFLQPASQTVYQKIQSNLVNRNMDQSTF